MFGGFSLSLTQTTIIVGAFTTTESHLTKLNLTSEIVQLILKSQLKRDYYLAYLQKSVESERVIQYFFERFVKWKHILFDLTSSNELLRKINDKQEVKS